MCVMIFKPSAKGPGVGPSPNNKVASHTWNYETKYGLPPISYSREWSTDKTRPDEKFSQDFWDKTWNYDYIHATGIAWIEDGEMKMAHFIAEWNNMDHQAYRLYADLDDAGFDCLIHFRGGGRDDMANCQPFHIHSLGRFGVFSMTMSMNMSLTNCPGLLPFAERSDARQAAEKYWPQDALAYRRDPALIPNIVGGQSVVYTADGRLDVLTRSQISNGRVSLPFVP